MNQRRRPRYDEPDVHTNRWAIKLEKASGESGYFSGVSADGISFHKEIGFNVSWYDSRRDAEREIRWLHEHFGLDIEEAKPEPFVFERTFGVWFKGDEWPDGISVELDEKTGRQYLLVPQGGEETSHDLPDEVADVMVRVLKILKGRLPSTELQ
jgi:hypothetical protein